MAQLMMSIFSGLAMSVAIFTVIYLIGSLVIALFNEMMSDE